MLNYDDLVAEASSRVKEIMPWVLHDWLEAGKTPILLDVREQGEFDRIHIAGSINLPRGVLEQGCEWNYDETVPELASGRARSVVVICRSGKRSVLAADALQRLGFVDVVSLKTGVRGWNDCEHPLINVEGEALDADAAEVLLAPRLRPDQKFPVKSH
jgi:rhodanese-related sulfurtransferase